MYPLSTEPLVGQTLAGKYTIRRLIGRGGVGVVYLANECGTGREVVVKCLAEHWLSDSEAVARFEREARRLDSLRHPNIVSMLGFERNCGRAFLVMEYVRGRPLSEYIASRGHITYEEFVPIAAQILKGMGYAHSREMMIRDVKPSNIMLCERKGRMNFVKILDFGLAKFLRGEAQITEEHVIGTVGYLAPETLKGEQGDLRVDVYAAGVLFYYMLSGHLPFEGANDATIFYKTVNEPPVDLRERLPPHHGVPDALIDLIHRCLEKSPENRPSDANLVVEQLIDAVPAHLFRLPRVGEYIANATTGSLSGNTGLISLVGADPRLKETAPVSDKAQRSRTLTRVVLGCAVALSLTIGGTAMAIMLGSGAREPPRQATAIAPDPRAVMPSPVERGPLFDTAPPEALATRSLAAMNTGDASEAAPSPPTSADAPPRAPDRDADEGVVLFDSSPVAKLFIDGEPRGITPFRGKLPVGTHSIRLEARDHESWESQYEVTATDNAPITVQLVEVPPPRAVVRRSQASTPPSTSTSAAPTSAAAPDIPPPPTSIASAETTVPTKASTPDALMPSRSADGKRDGVFLSREVAPRTDGLLIRNR